MPNPIRIKELAARGDQLTGGHRACAGCACATALRQAVMAAEDPLVVTFATGCMEVSTTIYPYTAWKVPYIHSCFENAAATASGVEAAYQSFRRQGKIDKPVKFIAFGGDGGAYMNTGIQRSSATPRGAATTTAPPGKRSYGKQEYPKDLTEILIAHGLPYVARSTPAHHLDFMKKVRRALEIEGPTFINVLASCNRGWRIPSEQSIEILRLAADTCFWPVYAVDQGKYRITYRPREKKPILDWLKAQRRYEHLFRGEDNQTLFNELQQDVDRRWERLQKLEQL